MIRLVVKWHDYPVDDDDDVKDEFYEKIYDCKNIEEAWIWLSKLVGFQYNGHELHDYIFLDCAIIRL